MTTPRQSRPRQRGAKKTPLSVEAVVRAALTCLNRGGPQEMTMRKVAAELETGPGSLYVYVRDQRELSVLVLDAIAAEIIRTRKKGSWEDRLIALLSAYADRLKHYPGAARLAMTTTPTGPSSLNILDEILRLFAEGEVPLAVSAWAGDALMLFTTASVAEHDALESTRNDESTPLSFEHALSEDTTQHPHLQAARDLLFTGKGMERLKWSLRAFLAGINTVPEPAIKAAK